MRISRLSAPALYFGISSAFQDASPFFLFSTSQLSNAPLDSLNIAYSAQIAQDTLRSLEDCPSKTYLIVEQPNARSADFASSKAAPNLRRQVQKEDEKVLASYTIPEVAGYVNTDGVKDYLIKHCGAQAMTPESFNSKFAKRNEKGEPWLISFMASPLPSSTKDRALQLQRNDEMLGDLLSKAADQSYTVIYTTTPPPLDAYSLGDHSQQVYEMDQEFPEAEHIELKRDFASHIRATDNSSLPLFETYQYLSPGEPTSDIISLSLLLETYLIHLTGLFMTGTVTIVLILILYVGVSAIASLEVSYAAFSKEMGPAAQKKQQ
ncbi:MAG: hypothetical protein M1820_010573 [Bogoriella megaspora]|nr:MAG: hypothetical protein M1820_010573 [Bogoriella megaspora]